MRRSMMVVIAMAAAVFAAPGVAADACAAVSGIAEQVMLARQGGTPMRNVTEMIEAMIAETDQPPGAAKILRGMVIKAYDQPKFATYDYQTGSAVEFSNEYFLGCKKGSLPVP